MILSHANIQRLYNDPFCSQKALQQLTLIVSCCWIGFATARSLFTFPNLTARFPTVWRGEAFDLSDAALHEKPLGFLLSARGPL